MMKKILLGAIALITLSVAASAAPVCTSGDVIWNLGVDQHYSCQLAASGPTLLFSNFLVSNANNDPTPTVNVTNAPLGQGLQNLPNALFSINPNLGPNQDIDISFTVTAINGAGPIQFVDLTVFGNAASVTETVCSVQITAQGCSGSETLLSDSSGGPQVVKALTPPLYTLYIFKDVLTQSGGGLSNFTESFTVPEPMTFSMIAAGLLALGLVRRKR